MKEAIRSLVITAIIAWVLHTVVKIVNRLFLSPLKSIPGPRLAAATFWYEKWYNIVGRRAHVIDSLHKRYGPIIRISPEEVSIVDLPSVAAIHNVHTNFRKGQFYSNLTKNGVHATIFSILDPQEHKQRRKLMAPAFSGTNLTQFEVLVREKIDFMFAKIRKSLDEKQVVDIYKWFTLFAADVTSDIAFGQDLGNIKAGQKSDYIIDLENILLIAGISANLPFGESIEFISHFIPNKKIKRLLDGRKRIREYGYQALQAYYDYMKTHDGAAGRSPLLSKLIEKTMTDARNFPPALVQAEISNLIIAGTDTSAITLTYIIWNIIKHEEVREQLKDEVGTLGGDFDDGKLAKLPYMKNVITESLRLYAAANGGLPREVPTEGFEVAGYHLPAGVTVSTQAYTLSRLSNVFHEPLRFDPTRWDNPTADMNTAYMPWGGGTRTCLGQNLAMMEIRLTIALFITTCNDTKLAPSCTDASMEMENYFLLRPIGHRCEIMT